MATVELSRDVDAHIVSLLSKIATLHEATKDHNEQRRTPMSTEARSLELWRAVGVECFATFLLLVTVLGAATSCFVYGTGNHVFQILGTAISAGVSMAAINLIFGHISGGHVNPAVSIAFALSRKISPLRAALYVAAQCGGGLAGAAMLNGVFERNDPIQFNPHGSPVERLLIEITMSMVVILAHFAADTPRNLSLFMSRRGGVLAAAYTSATLVKNPFLNPARVLGPAFLLSRWANQWIFWVGPIAGAILSALVHEYVLRPKRSRDSHEMDDADNSSMRSDEDAYDDFDKPTGPKFPTGYATYRPVAGASASIYSAPPTAIERVESIYGGTKSLYCKSPPLTRANLNRSQSVYAKSSSSPRDGFVIPKPGPLVPAQSLYHMRLGSASGPPAREPLPGPPSSSPGQHGPTQSQNHNSTNQNMQNQLQQCTQSIYGIRGISTSLSARENGIYGITTGSSIYARAPAPAPSPQSSQASQNAQSQPSHSPPSQTQPPPAEINSNPRRPESMYGHVSRRSDDSAYGSYQGSNRGNYGKITGPPPPPPPGHGGPGGLSSYREQRPSPGPLQQNQAHQGNFQRNSPNPQY